VEVRTVSRYVFAVCVVLMAAGVARGQAGQSVRERADILLRRMTVEEKAGQLNQASGVKVGDDVKKVEDEAIEKGRVGSILWLVDVKEINRLQHVAVDRSRLHIPLIFGFDVIHGYRTAFPVPLAMASSWDPSVEEQAQKVAAEDTRAAGIEWTFAPMLDIARDARWGRIVEGAGEDPYLGSAMVRARRVDFREKRSARPAYSCAQSTSRPMARRMAVATTILRTFPRSCCEMCTCLLFMRQ